MELLPAIAAARIITEVSDEKRSAIPSLMIALKPVTIKYRHILDKKKPFSHTLTSPGHYKIIMHASDHPIEEDYTPREETPEGTHRIEGAHVASIQGAFEIGESMERNLQKEKEV